MKPLALRPKHPGLSFSVFSGPQAGNLTASGMNRSTEPPRDHPLHSQVRIPGRCLAGCKHSFQSCLPSSQPNPGPNSQKENTILGKLQLGQSGLRIAHRLAGGPTEGQNVPAWLSDQPPGLRSPLEPSENPAGQWCVQWMVELFCCEKYHERITSTTMVTMGNNGEPARPGYLALAVIVGGNAGWFRNPYLPLFQQKWRASSTIFRDTILLTGIFTRGPLRLINNKEG